VRRGFVTCTVATFLAMSPFTAAQEQRTVLPGADLTISVHDYANVSDASLASAIAQASQAFRRAGLATVWLTCGPRVQAVEPRACASVDETHLMLKILPRAVNAQVKDRLDVLGTALLDDKGGGFFACVYYDHVRRLAEHRALGSEVLGAVLAHEIGHLLLGSNRHSVSGLMSAHWQANELRAISEGAMDFGTAESKSMQKRLHALQSARHSESDELTGNTAKQKSEMAMVAAAGLR
jgi:hypothetical protein